MAVATAVILAGVVVVAVGRGGEMAYFTSDYAPLDLGVVAATDVVLLRPPTSIWGYNIQVTDEALDRITQALSQRDIRIASLEQQVADLRAERDLRLDHGRRTDPDLREERDLPGPGLRAAGHSGPGAFPDSGPARWEARAAGWVPAATEPRPGGLHRRVPATQPHPGVGTGGPEAAPSRTAAAPSAAPSAAREPAGPSRDAALADGDTAGPSRDALTAAGPAGPTRDAAFTDGDTAQPRGDAVVPGGATAGSGGDAAAPDGATTRPSPDTAGASPDAAAPAADSPNGPAGVLADRGLPAAEAEHAGGARDGGPAEPGAGRDGDAAGA